jgi:acyl-CoA synthetase (AMP-forming)/AMP-acid ligase II
VYIIYTGGTTGYPKGVMWRHEDIWRTLAGGIDFVTGVPLSDEWEQSRTGLDRGEFVKLCAAPLFHGNAQVAALAGLFTGETIVMLPAFDPHEIWRAVQRHQVNVLVIIGDAMARPLVEAYLAGDYDVSSLVALSSSAALFSPAVKDAWESPGAPEPLRMPLQNLLVSEAHQRLMRSGQPDVVPMPAGQIIGRMTEVRPVADVMADLVRETDEVLERLHGLR